MRNTFSQSTLNIYTYIHATWTNHSFVQIEERKRIIWKLLSNDRSYDTGQKFEITPLAMLNRSSRLMIVAYRSIRGYLVLKLFQISVNAWFGVMDGR